MEEYNIEASGDWAGKRIDKVLSGYFSDYSRSFIKKLFDDGYIQVNGKASKPSYSVRTGDIFDISVPDPVSIDIEPENIPLDIIYEDDDVILVNKPKGMVVHPAPGHYSGTLVNGLMYHFKDSLSGINGEFRPGIVHRIDMDTTGVLVVCKTHGNIAQDDGTVDAPIGRSPKDRKKMAINTRNGRHAVTHYRVLERFGGKYTFIECQLETGRTHQIRVHMASIGHPILGDEVYGPKKCPFKLQGQTLHAGILGFEDLIKKLKLLN